MSQDQVSYETMSHCEDKRVDVEMYKSLLELVWEDRTILPMLKFMSQDQDLDPPLSMLETELQEKKREKEVF